jgi:hypothetical protein
MTSLPITESLLFVASILFVLGALRVRVRSPFSRKYLLVLSALLLASAATKGVMAGLALTGARQAAGILLLLSAINYAGAAITLLLAQPTPAGDARSGNAAAE